MLQRVHSHADMAHQHARVPAECCADLVPPCDDCCAVGHDQRAHAAADAVESAADGHDAQRVASGDWTQPARLQPPTPKLPTIILIERLFLFLSCVCSVRSALQPFVNKFEAWMLPEARCVHAICCNRGAMARVWLGQEGGEGKGRVSHNSAVRFMRMMMIYISGMGRTGKRF